MTPIWMRWVILVCLFCISVSGNAVAPRISGGLGSTAMLKQDGTVWGVGSITDGSFAALQPTRLFPSITDAVAVATLAADYALRANGELWASGRNWQGQVGDGTTNYRVTPYKVLDGVMQFSAGHSTAMAVKSDGSVWAWGNNETGQLGDGTRTQRLAPVRINGLANVVMVAAGIHHSAALAADGTVWAWGFRERFADGDPNSYPEDDPRAYVLTPRQLPGLENIVSIAAGSGTLALDSSGRLWSGGASWDGMLGNGSMFKGSSVSVQVAVTGKVKAFSDNGRHALALTEDGSVWTWGSNSSGELGVPGSSINPTPVKLSLPQAAVDVAAGWSHSAVLLADGRVMTFGDNSTGQLGRGLFQSDSVPGFVVSESGSGNFNVNTPATANLSDAPSVQISTNGTLRGGVPLTVALTASGNAANGHSVVRYDWVSSDGSLRAQGASVNMTFPKPGALDVYVIATDDSGLKGAASQHVVPLPANVPVSITPQIAAGGTFGFNALTSSGSVYSWGMPYHLGAGALPGGNGLQGSRSLPVDPGLRGILKIAATHGTSRALTHDGLVLSWGFNNAGSLGIGSTVDASWDPVLVPLPLPATDIVTAGPNAHSFALLSDGTVWAWGDNGFGQLGLSDTAARNLPVKVPGIASVVKIAASERNGYAIDRDGTVWAWGDNSQYQLGQGDTTVRFGVVQVAGLPPIAKIAVGNGFVFAIARDGRFFGWAFSNRILDDPTLTKTTAPVQVPALAEFTELVSGSIYMLGVKSDGTVWTWGQNDGLGMPGTTAQYEPRPIPVPGVVWPLAMTASPSGGAIVLQDGHILTWGMNNFGQIGDGTFARRLSPVLVVNETADDFLDLSPESPNSIPQDKIPPFLLAAYASGSLNSATLYADLKGPMARTSFASEKDYGRFAAAYNVYVAASVPSGASMLYFQLDSGNNWSSFTWPMKEFMRGVTLDSSNTTVKAQILQNADLTGLTGAEILVGYGTDADEMLNNGRYRTIFTVPTQ